MNDNERVKPKSEREYLITKEGATIGNSCRREGFRKYPTKNPDSFL